MKLKLRLYLMIKNDAKKSANYDSDFMPENYDLMFNFLNSTGFRVASKGKSQIRQ